MGAFYFNEPFDQNHWAEILTETYKNGIYAPYVAGGRKPVCLELGANLGLVAYYFSQHFDKVYAVEPASDNYAILEKNIKANKLTNVTPIKVAISNKIGETNFYHSINKTMNSLDKIVSDAKSIKETVKTTTIEQLMEDQGILHIDLLKLDVEGEEANIIGSDSFRRVADKIDVIVFEYHSWCNRNPMQLKTTLNDLGFDWGQAQCEATVYICSRIK